MKKFITLLLSCCLLLAMTACSSSNDTSVDNDTTTSQDSDATSDMEITFDGLTVVDDEYCYIRITGINPDDEWGYAIKADYENRLDEDITLNFYIAKMSVNNLQVTPYSSYNLTSGSSGGENIYPTDDLTLEEAGMEYFTDIELTFLVYDVELQIEYEDVTVHIYPHGEEYAYIYEREAQDSDTVLIDNDYVTVAAVDYDPDNYIGYAVTLYLENKTDQQVKFLVDNGSINGYSIDPYYFAAVVQADKGFYSNIYWDSSEIEDLDITSIDEITFDLVAYNSEDIFSESYFDETVTINP